jgi:peptidoglycan/LPS O-acetylase OafA/YrhL
MKFKIPEIHFLRAFGVIGVILLHVLATNQNHFLFINKFIGSFLGYVIPLFIFISGFVLTISYNPATSLMTFYKKRLSGIIIPYFVFANLYYLYAIFYNYIPPDRINFHQYLSAILTAKTYYHLWFFSMLIQLYILFPMLVKFYKKTAKYDKIFLFLLFIIQLIWNILNIKFPKATLGAIFPMFLFYFVFGIFSAHHFAKINEIIQKSNLFICSSIYILLNIALFQFESIRLFIYPISFVLLFAILYKIASLIKDKNNMFISFLSLIASYSLGIYLMHAFCIDFARNILIKFNISYQNLLFNPVSFILTLLISLFICYCLSFLPFAKNIIGSKK